MRGGVPPGGAARAGAFAAQQPVAVYPVQPVALQAATMQQMVPVAAYP